MLNFFRAAGKVSQVAPCDSVRENAPEVRVDHSDLVFEIVEMEIG